MAVAGSLVLTVIPTPDIPLIISLISLTSWARSVHAACSLQLFLHLVWFSFTFACLTISHDYSTLLIKRLFICISANCSCVMSCQVKMAPLMAAFVASSAVVFMFLLVCPVFSHIPAICFTRDELLDIRKYTPPNISPDFVYSDVLLDIVVGGAAVLFRRYRTRRWGKRAGTLVKLCRQGLRTPLPSIHLANLRSLPNKPLSRLNKDFSNSAALCFMETWLNGTIPDSALHLPNFQLIRADRDAESMGKSRALICFYINKRWCTDVTVLKKMCCYDLETLFINCKPFYSPREFCSFILVSVYIPPQAHMSSALQKLADLITDTEQQHPDSVLIILGDFNKANLSRELPKYRQHVTEHAGSWGSRLPALRAFADEYASLPEGSLWWGSLH